MDAGIASIIVNAVERALRAGRIEELEQLLATIRLNLSPSGAAASTIPASAKATLLLCGAACAHLLGLLEEADRYLCRLADLTLSTMLSANQLSASQRIHVRVHLDLGNHDLAHQVLDELDHDVLHLGAEQVLTEREGRTFYRRTDSVPRIFGDSERVTPATHLLASEYFLAIGQIQRAAEEVQHASSKIARASSDDQLALSLLEALLAAIDGDSRAYGQLEALEVRWRDEETDPDQTPNVPAELKGRLAAILSWDPDEDPPTGINKFEARRWRLFSALIPPQAKSSSGPQAVTKATVLAFPAPADSSDPVTGLDSNDQNYSNAVEQLDRLDPFADFFDDFENLEIPVPAPAVPPHVASLSRGLPIERLVDQPFDVGRTEQNVLSVPDLAAFPFDSILTTLEQAHITGELDLFWTSAIVDSAVSDSVLEQPVDCCSGTIFFKDGRIIDAVLTGDGDCADIPPYEGLSIMVRLALSVGQGISAFLRRSDTEDQPATLKVVSNSSILLEILGTLDEASAGIERDAEQQIAEFEHPLAPSDAIPTSDAMALLDTASAIDLMRRLREVTAAERSELLYAGSVLYEAGPLSEIIPVELDAGPFRLRIFGDKRSTGVTQALLMIAATRFLAMPNRATDFLEPGSEEIVADSDEMNQIIWRAKRLAKTVGVETGLPKPILLLGEPGVGKEVIARYIHSQSRRSVRAFVAANMSCVQRDLCATLLFGQAKGAFTGATQDRQGLVSEAEGGTLLLDEIGEMDERDQAKLLRVLQTGNYHTVGRARESVADVQFILATNRNAKTDLRQDMLGRCIVLTIPPLRARKSDIRPLTLRFAAKAGITLSESALLYLEQQEWPGNVRQLEKVIGECRVFQDDTPDMPVTAATVASLYDQPVYEPLGRKDDFAGPTLPVLLLDETLQQAERRFSRAVLGEVLAATDQNVAQAARLLGISPQGLRKRARNCGFSIRGGSDEEHKQHPTSN